MSRVAQFPNPEMQPARPYPPHMREFAPMPFEAAPPVDDALTRLEAFNTIYELSKRYSAARVTRWVKSAASILGQDTERPADRCLADGAALVNSVCVHCGRDNS